MAAYLIQTLNHKSLQKGIKTGGGIQLRLFIFFFGREKEGRLPESEKVTISSKSRDMVMIFVLFRIDKLEKALRLLQPPLGF